MKETVKGLEKILDREIASPEEMFHYGAEVAPLLAKPNLILALKGDLGVGKTTFLKGFISTLAKINSHQIQSPTFTYLQIYNEFLYHFDLYRLKHYEQFESAGFADYLQAGGICCIEWPERIEKKLPDKTVFLQISYLGPQLRKCFFYQKASL
ncbi:MAG: tRNA (adenosine(37)-N6)-threonylcarbamoyltransferase complex ATPase subunit type 1 TsaE [Rhabdochlamydiaceae bacterium]